MYFDKALASHKSCVEVDANGNVTGLLVHRMEEGRALANLNIMILKRELLIKLVNDAVSRGQKDFQHDIIGKNIKRLKIGGYRYDGLFYFIDSLPRYFSANMSLLDKSVAAALFGVPYRPVYTKVKDSAPTKFFKEAKALNSSIADGCEIKGAVENCLLFRDVFVSCGAVLKNCIVMQNGFIGDNCVMEYCLLDKNVTVSKDNVLRGSYNLPYVVSKSMVI
jgi:glucose-1-phosphate adenylyltransferase